MTFPGSVWRRHSNQWWWGVPLTWREQTSSQLPTTAPSIIPSSTETQTSASSTVRARALRKIKFTKRCANCKPAQNQLVQYLRNYRKQVVNRLDRFQSEFSEHFVPAKMRKKRVDINPFCHVLVAADDYFHSRIGGNDAVTTITEIVGTDGHWGVGKG